MERETGIISPNSTIILNVKDDEDKLRLDIFLAQRFSEFSRTFFQKLIKSDCVQVNSTVIIKHSAPLKVDDKVSVHFPHAQSYQIEPKEFSGDLGVQIIFEHPDFVIIHKPAGLVVHPTSAADQSITLIDWILQKYPTIDGLGMNDRPGIVHRLDKDTSGIMIIARTRKAQEEFSDMFRDRSIQKEYRAIVEGHPERSETIDFPISRDRGVKNKMTYKNEEGRLSKTHFEVIEYYQDTTLLSAKPVTGRTHQIRVHCVALGHPIIGDALYGKVSKKIKRQALHAYRISFVYKGKEFSFISQMSDDMEALLSTFQKVEV